MDINFKSKKLEKIFNSSRELQKVYGEQSNYIMRRMGVLSAAENLFQVPAQKPERRHELTGDKKYCFAVDLKHPFRLVFVPNHDRDLFKEDGGLDLEKITAITILSVEDYH